MTSIWGSGQLGGVLRNRWVVGTGAAAAGLATLAALASCAESQSSDFSADRPPPAASQPAPRVSTAGDDWIPSVCKLGSFGERTERGETRGYCVSASLPNRPITISKYPSNYLAMNFAANFDCTAYGTITDDSGSVWLFQAFPGLGGDPADGLAPLKPFGFQIGMAHCKTARSAPTVPPQGPAATPTPQPSGSNPTIASYIKENGIVETPVKRGDSGSPTINLPVPPGWKGAGNRAPDWAYAAILLGDPSAANDAPTVIALVSKLSGNVDPAEILRYAPNEIRNLPGYKGAQQGTSSTLSGFAAIQIGGTYTKDGVKRAIAQKTVVIPGANGLYVLQLNADGTEDQMGALMDATGVIDEQTTITP
jgi:hypothetical protein